MSPETAASFNKTLELGKDIANDLADHDILGRWMAHHISDLIMRAETSPLDEADDIRRATAATILELWRHRATLPVEYPPMASFEPVFRTLARLSEPQDPWSFYRTFSPGREPDEGDMSSIPLLRNALALEDAVRGVVRHVVALASRESANREAKWLDRSEYLAKDEQRKAIDAVRQLTRAVTAEIEDSGDDADWDLLVPYGSSDLVTMLLWAETNIKEIRQALEERHSETDSAAPTDD
ncbi:hypothetical protein [Streptomyces phytophilus]|uniref:hypothetical protein n=1 Tax=Streptomyces phytophilus TaxID=722715 RepID=UPI0015F007BF|nr:hypothetical protein [Streptomyces phytophilus]